MIPPPRRIAKAPTVLFAASAIADAPAERVEPKPPAHESCLDIAPFVDLRIHTDGRAGAAAPLAIAQWDCVERCATERLVEYQRRIEFIERWLKLPKREKVELRA